jgi:hypothetical protein
MQFRFDQAANALYIAINPGQLARTIEVTDMVSVINPPPGGIADSSASFPHR